MKEFCTLRAKTYAYLSDDNSEYRKANITQKCVIKRRTMFKNYTNCLFNNKTMLRPQQVFRSDHHDEYTVKTNTIALRSNNDGYKYLMGLQHIRMEQIYLKHVKVRYLWL